MSHHIDLDELTASERYKLLTALVIPRPIAWVTTVSSEGINNAAPYSFFNVFVRPCGHYLRSRTQGRWNRKRY